VPSPVRGRGRTALRRWPSGFALALRQSTGFVESLPRLIDLGWTVPTFSTLGPCQKTHAEQHLHRQAGLNGGVTVNGLPSTLAGRLRRPRYTGIEPDCQRPAALERVRHCARTSGASMAHYTRASSASCRSVRSVCSWPPATTLDSQDESLTGFVQQSPPLASGQPARVLPPAGIFGDMKCQEFRTGPAGVRCDRLAVSVGVSGAGCGLG